MLSLAGKASFVGRAIVLEKGHDAIISFSRVTGKSGEKMEVLYSYVSGATTLGF